MSINNILLLIFLFLFFLLIFKNINFENIFKIKDTLETNVGK
jgi:hypothetical protein